VVSRARVVASEYCVRIHEAGGWVMSYPPTARSARRYSGRASKAQVYKYLIYIYLVIYIYIYIYIL
jgi:hypothetical protein